MLELSETSVAGLYDLTEAMPTDLGTTHIDSVTAPGDYTQIYLSRANKAQGYPYDDVAGTLEIRMWNEGSNSVIAVFKPWTDVAMAKRAYYGGTWREWRNVDGSPIA